MRDKYKKLADKIMDLRYPWLKQMCSSKQLKIEGVRDKIAEMIRKFVVEEKANL